MNLSDFLQRVKAGQAVEFEETMAVIAQHYNYCPAEFGNGIIEPILNAAGANEGSCKIFAFGKLHGLSQEQTLALFGAYYRHDVLGAPDGRDHANIRRFMRDGWEGIVFSGEALRTK